MARERIVVGMSGGVDSSVAAALLVEQGHDVVGVTLRVWPWRADEDPTRRFGSCCSSESVDDARQVARRLGIPYYLLNTEREFDRAVIAGFVDEYRAGRTPVPCVLCNRDVKFGSLLHRARAWDAVAVATSRPLYVVDLDPERNAVVVGTAEALEQARLTADQANFIACDPPQAPLRVAAKIRHNHAPAPATIRALEPGRVEVVFDRPQRA